MTSEEFSASLERLGLSQSEASRIMLVDGRTVRRWVAGDREIPGPVVALLRLLEDVPAALRWAKKAGKL